MSFLASFICGFLPMLLYAWILYWLDRYEKEPKLLLGVVFLWGVIISAGSAFVINTLLGVGVYLFTNSPFATDLATGSIIAPIVEEVLKGMAVLGEFLLFRSEFDSHVDGIIYAGVVALGFAATENTYYILNYGFNEAGWEGFWYLVFVRVILVGWQHPFYTAFFGIGLALARLNQNLSVKIIAPMAGLAIAMITHAFHNTVSTFLTGLSGTIIGAVMDWSGWLFMFIFLLVLLFREQGNMKRQLWEEVTSGVITQAHFRTATSAWRQAAARLASIFTGRFRNTKRFFQVCGELAHKKQQFQKVGDEGGNAALIAGYRAELAALATQVQV